MRLFRHALAAWNAFWFAPESALNLGAARVLICLHSLWLLLSRDFAGISDIAPVWEHTPAEVRWRFLIVPGHAELEGVLAWCALAALAFGLVGVYPRVSCLVAGLLLYHLAPFETAFRGAVPYGRGLTLAPTALVLMAAAPSADALAPGRGLGADRPPSGAYGWPLRLVQLLVCQIYLFAGYGKLVATGLAWGSPAGMRHWLLWANVDPLATTFHGPGLWLAGLPDLLLGLIGMGTLLLELGFVCVLFLPRTRRWLIPLTLAFNASLLVVINAHVPEVWLILIFVNWHALFGRAPRVARPRPTPA